MFCSTSGALAHLPFQIISLGLQQCLMEHFESSCSPASPEYCDWVRQNPFGSKISDHPAVSIVYAKIDFKNLSLHYRKTTYGQFLFYSNLLPHFPTTQKKPKTIGLRMVSGLSRIWPIGNTARVAVCVTTRDSKMILAKRHARNVTCPSAWMTTVSEQIRPYFGETDSPAMKTVHHGLCQETCPQIARSCCEITCLGVVDRIGDYYHPTLMFHAQSSLVAQQILDLWHQNHIAERDEFAEENPVTAIDVSSPQPLLELITAKENRWSPQHAACALLVLAKSHEKSVKAAGLKLPL